MGNCKHTTWRDTVPRYSLALVFELTVWIENDDFDDDVMEFFDESIRWDSELPDKNGVVRIVSHWSDREDAQPLLDWLQVRRAWGDERA